MSADDFQSKCASVMESMIKSAISETTKLFETMVNELKTEISKLKNENDLLKKRCNRYEKTISQVALNTQEGHLHDGSEKRDTAVQCEHVPYCTLLMEQQQSPSDSQEEHCRCRVMEDNLARDQCCGTHEDGNSEMTYAHVKSEEETEDTRLGGQVISYDADSLPTFAESEVPLSDQDSSNGDVKKDGDSRLAMEVPPLEMDISGQGSQNQLYEPEQSIVTSVAAVNKDMEEETSVDLNISEEFQRGMTSSPIGRGQHSIKVKQQKPDREVILISSTDIPEDKEVNSCHPIGMGETEAFAAVDKVNIASSKVLHGFRENSTSATFQNAILPVQAMNQTKEDDTFSQQIFAPFQTQTVCTDVSPHSEEPSVQLSTLPAPSQNPSLPLLKHNLPVAALCTPQSTVSSLCGTSLTTDSFKTNTSHSQIKVITLCNTTTTTTTSTSSTPVMSSSLKIPHINSVPNTIIVVPRSLSSVVSHSISPLSPTQISTVVSKVAAAKNIPSLPASTGIGLITPSLSSVTQRTPHVRASKSALTTIGFTDAQSGIRQSPKITIVVSRQMLARAKKQKAQTKLSTTQESVIPTTTYEARQFIGSSQEIKTCKDGNESVGEVTRSSSTDCSIPLSIRKEFSQDTTQEEPSSVDTLTHFKKKTLSVSEVPVLPPDNPYLKETAVSKTENASQMSGNSSETLLEEALGSSHMKLLVPCTESTLVPVKSTLEFKTSEFVAISLTACEPTYSLDEEKDASKQLPSITSIDMTDPRLQMSKNQFLAQLAVSPVLQDQQQSSTHDQVPDAPLSCAETSMCNKRKLKGNSLVERLRGHLKYHLQVRCPKTKQEPVEETEISDFIYKKPRLENVCTNERETTSELIHVCTKKTSASLNRITNATPRMKSGENDIGLERTIDKPMATCANPRQLQTPKDSSTTKANSPALNSRILRSRKISVSPEKSNVTTVTPLKRNLSLDIAGLSYPLSLTSSKDGMYPVNINVTAVSPRSSRSKESLGSKNWNTYSGSHRKLSSSENDKHCRMTSNAQASLKRTKSTSLSSKNSQRPGCAQRSGLSENEDDSPNMSTIESISVGANKDSSCTRESIRVSKFLPMKSSFPHTTLSKDKVCQRQAKRNPNVMNAKKLTKAAKAKTIEKMKKAKLQSEASTTYSSINATSCEVVKRFKAKAVWTPPKMPASKSNSLRGKKSLLLEVKNNTQSSTSLYSSGVSLRTLPIRTAQIISPLQPLSVIGRRLLKNQCGECGRVLSSSASLESHVSLHTGHRPFSCTLCGKSFPDSKGLKRHGRVHRNGRIHICQQCGKGFVYRFGLTKHIQMVHGRIKPFVCQVCSKAFFTKRDVEAHIRIHTGEKPFPCHLCAKRFARRVELNVHLRWHNGEKRHWCPYCGKGFLDFNNLKRHKYIHTGEKPHSCPHCPKHFTQSGHLKKHLKNVHKVH